MTTSGPVPTDAELVRALVDGDRQVLRTLYDRHAPWLTLRLERRCANPDVVDSVVQDTFIAVWQKAATWSGRGPVAAWIWGIAVRKLIDRLRREPGSRHVPWPWSWREPWEERTATGPSAEEQVLLGVEFGDLAGALNRLSPELRAVVQATVLDGLSTHEAATLLGVPSGTVKSRMHRARLQLREELA